MQNISLSTNSPQALSTASPDALDALPPLAMPEPVSQLPLTPGWIILTVIIILGVVALGRAIYQRYLAGKLKREAVLQYQGIFEQYQLSGNKLEYLQQSNALLKAFCIQQFPARALAASSGGEWLRALDEIAGQTLFLTTVGKQLYAHHQRQADVDIEALHTLIGRWFKLVNPYQGFPNPNIDKHGARVQNTLKSNSGTDAQR